MTSAGELAWRIRTFGRRLVRRARAQVHARRSAVDMGTGIQIGRGCRLILEPGAKLALGDRVEVDDFTTLAVYRGAALEIGAGCFVGHHCTLAAKDHISIGDGTYLAEMVSVRDHDHEMEHVPSTGLMRTAAVHVGRDVWLAAKVTVTSGIEIGDSTVVGANAVVTRSLESGVVAAGIPAEILRPTRPPTGDT